MEKFLEQPELGLSIARIRQSKGWTQDELGQKCNVSLRTIQRIESGNVLPRGYTVRLIFGALDSKNGLDSVNAAFPQRNNGSPDSGSALVHVKPAKTRVWLAWSGVTFGLVLLALFLKVGRFRDPGAKEPVGGIEPALVNDLEFVNFSCQNCFEEANLLVGRDINFTLDGVHIQAGIFILDPKTKEFNMGPVKGRILPDHLVVQIAAETLSDSVLVYSALNQERSEHSLALNGNASLSSKDGRDRISAKRITINLH